MNYDSDLEVSNAHLHSAYQRSFYDNLGWGWHWYRSSLRRKAPEATESDLALLLTFWALFLTVHNGQSRYRICFRLASIHYVSFIRGNCSACVVTRQFLVSVLVLEDYWDLCALCQHTPTYSVLFARVGQMMLDRLQNAFVRMWRIWGEQNLVWISHLINNHYRAPPSQIL